MYIYVYNCIFDMAYKDEFTNIDLNIVCDTQARCDTISNTTSRKSIIDTLKKICSNIPDIDISVHIPSTLDKPSNITQHKIKKHDTSYIKKKKKHQTNNRNQHTIEHSDNENNNDDTIVPNNNSESVHNINNGSIVPRLEDADEILHECLFCDINGCNTIQDDIYVAEFTATKAMLDQFNSFTQAMIPPINTIVHSVANTTLRDIIKISQTTMLKSDYIHIHKLITKMFKYHISIHENMFRLNNMCRLSIVRITNTVQNYLKIGAEQTSLSDMKAFLELSRDIRDNTKSKK